MSDYVRGTPSFAVVDVKLLHEPYTKDMLAHDPYTPESVESHSPLPDDKKPHPKKQSVSPTMLKSRLENILRSEKENCLSEQSRLGYTQFDTIKLLSCRADAPDHFLSHTKSDSASKFLGYINDDNTSYNKPIYKENYKFLSKSHSQHLDNKSLDSQVFHRARAYTEVTRKVSRAKLISSQSAQSIHRLQSHHSSSDEEWFEFEEVEIPENVFLDETGNEPNKEIVNDDIESPKQKKIKKKQKIDACCRIS